MAKMTLKEIETLKSKALDVTELSQNTKTQVVTSDLNKMTQAVKKHLNSKKDVLVAVIELPKERQN
jgi:hypothetical protein